MIYSVAELSANATECLILLYFLIKIFGFKSSSEKINIIKTSAFGIGLFSFVSYINQLFTIEGAYVVFDIVILFLFTQATLKGRWWKHLILSIIEIAVIFAVNFTIVAINAIINGKEFLETFSAQNPYRVYLLIVSKVILFLILAIIQKIIKNSSFELAKLQYISAIVVMIISLAMGSSLAAFMTYNDISSVYGSVVLICLIVIDFLLLFVIFQFNSINQSKIKKELLETQINEYEKRIRDAVQWNNEISSLRHDLKNHFIVLHDYISNDRKEKALKYIKETTDKVDNTHRYIHTNNMVLDAIINAKKTVCEEEKINVKTYIEENLPSLDDRAFCIIFGNLFDNAIEAEIKEPDKRIILAIKVEGDYIHLIIQNKIECSVLTDNAFLNTTKADTRSHGIGIKSITTTLDEINGIINFIEKDGWFIADVLIPFES